MACFDKNFRQRISTKILRYSLWARLGAVALAALFVAPFPATVQSQAVALPAGEVDRPAVVRPPGVPQIPGLPPSPAAPDEKRLQELLKLPFDRRPPAILQAIAKLPERDSITNEVQRFQTDVVAGNWKAVGEFLRQLPEGQATQVFARLLQELQKPPGQQSQGPPPPQQPGAQPPVPALLPDDILALADIAPGELTGDQAETLGRMLGQVLTRGVFVEPFIARLEAGTERLGGKDEKKRQLAASLLIAANRLTEAVRFLPPLDRALEQKDAKTINLHARVFAAAGREKGQSDSLRKAWDATQSLMALTNAPAVEREQALQRALELMPQLKRELGNTWLSEVFNAKPAQGRNLLAAAGSLVAQSSSSRDADARRRNLELQRQVVEALLATAGADIQSWRDSLNLLTLSWLQEADTSNLRHGARRNIGQQYDPYGNPIYYGPGGPQDPNQMAFIPVEQIIPTAPGENWLAAIDPGLAPRVRVTTANLYLKNEEEEKALPLVETIAAVHPKAALDLANELLRGWARNNNPNTQMPMNRYGMAYYGPYGQQQPQGVPLTRAMQVRNLNELDRILGRLRKLPIDSLDEKAVVAAFSAAHSVAEVFRIEDIEAVFGALDKIGPETLSELLQTMRQRLAGQWRQPRVQQQAQTKRTDKELEAEMTRGYELVTQLVDRGLAERQTEWRMHLVHAAVWFDWAEFDYGRKVDLAIYTEKRDRAFGSFERAAQLYAASLANLEEKDETPQVYQQWFNAALGASDLAYITRQQEPNTNHLAKVRQAIASLPGEAAERHVTAFGKAITEGVNTLKGELKPRYVRSALRVTGDHPSVAEIKRLATYYDDLLQEITLDVRVDGDTTVGHGGPFGVFVTIRHTEALGRESGGFAKYLQNLQNNQYYYNPYGQQPVNYRDEFDKQVREKLGEGFDVLSVTFHDDKVQPRGFGRPGWRETPYAYLLLKAKDGAVDRIPPLQLDMDFFDRRGQAILPVTSQIQLVDARPKTTLARPVNKLTLLQILDDRDLKSGKLVLEIKASGRGLIPELKDLLDLNLSGLRIDKTNDQGLAVTKFDSEGAELAAICEHNWLIELTRDPSRELPVAFQFPKPKIPGLELTYKRYADADLVEVQPEIALAGIQVGPENRWKPVALGGAGLVLLAIVVWVWRKRSPAEVTTRAATYVLPAHVTPFTVLTLLRRMHNDRNLRLAEERRGELGRLIADLERNYFAQPINGHPPPDLERVAREWVALAE